MISIRIYITYKAPEERRSFDNMMTNYFYLTPDMGKPTLDKTQRMIKSRSRKDEKRLVVENVESVSMDGM